MASDETNCKVPINPNDCTVTAPPGSVVVPREAVEAVRHLLTVIRVRPMPLWAHVMLATDNVRAAWPDLDGGTADE